MEILVEGKDILTLAFLISFTLYEEAHILLRRCLLPRGKMVFMPPAPTCAQADAPTMIEWMG